MGLNFYTDTATSTASEVDLFDINLAGSHAFKIFLKNIQDGDKIRIRVYDWDDETPEYVLHDEIIFENLQTLKSWVTPFVASQRYKVSLQRLAGSDRTYNWTRIEVT